MQKQVATSFAREEVLTLLDQGNLEKLMKVGIDVFKFLDIDENKEFVDVWTALFRKLISHLSLEFVKSYVMPRATTFISPKQSYAWRVLGFELLLSLVNGHGEKAINEEPLLGKGIY